MPQTREIVPFPVMGKLWQGCRDQREDEISQDSLVGWLETRTSSVEYLAVVPKEQDYSIEFAAFVTLPFVASSRTLSLSPVGMKLSKLCLLTICTRLFIAEYFAETIIHNLTRQIVPMCRLPYKSSERTPWCVGAVKESVSVCLFTKNTIGCRKGFNFNIRAKRKESRSLFP